MLERHFQMNYSVGVRDECDGFHVGLLDGLHLAPKPGPRSSSARPAMPFVNQERLVLKLPTLSGRQRLDLYQEERGLN